MRRKLTLLCQFALCPRDTRGRFSGPATTRKRLTNRRLLARAEFGTSAAKGEGARRSAEAVAGPVAANRSRRRAGTISATQSKRVPTYMKAARMKAARATASQEPIGIIISPGASKDAAPARFAYIWAPPPEEKGDEGRAGE